MKWNSITADRDFGVLVSYTKSRTEHRDLQTIWSNGILRILVENDTLRISCDKLTSTRWRHWQHCAHSTDRSCVWFLDFYQAPLQIMIHLTEALISRHHREVVTLKGERNFNFQVKGTL